MKEHLYKNSFENNSNILSLSFYKFSKMEVFSIPANYYKNKFINGYEVTGYSITDLDKILYL